MEPGTPTGLSHLDHPRCWSCRRNSQRGGAKASCQSGTWQALLPVPGPPLEASSRKRNPGLRLTRGQDCGPGAPEARTEEGHLPALRKLVEMTGGGEVRCEVEGH